MARTRPPGRPARRAPAPLAPRLRALLAPLLALPALLVPTLGAADDTEVFFARAADATLAPNILFMFDVSGSMDDFDGTPYRRITRLKQAMLEILEATDGINVGIGAFNGYQSGGAILEAGVDPERDACPDAGCASIEIRVPLLGGADDVIEAADTSVALDGAALDFNDRAGLRFADVAIPRGATVRHAVIEFVPTREGSAAGDTVVRAEASDDAGTFAATDGSVSARAATAANVTWSPSPWYRENFEEQTSDLAPLVQEVVNRDGWCGGNAMAFLFEGGADRESHSFESSAWDAPVLKISYDPRTVSFADTCASRRVVAGIVAADDDVEELADGALVTNTQSLDPDRAGLNRAVGLRFADVDIPRGASISSAYLRLASAGATGGSASVAIRLQPADNAPPFDPALTGDVTARTATGASVSWNIPPALGGERLTSPDIGALIAGVVARPGWNRDAAMVVTLAQGGGSTRDFHAFDGDGAAPVLEIRYRLDARVDPEAFTIDPVPLRTERENLIDTVLGFRFRAATPLVDALHESALYLLGEPVHHGLARGEQSDRDRYFRLSSPDTYSGGTLYTPPDCREVDPNALVCTGERIDDAPLYRAPPTGSCQTNQIVLLSDGQATSNNSRDEILALIGADDCEARDNEHESCGPELAAWLRDGTTTARAPILTNTIGFNNDDPFLTALAEAGGGLYQTADSAAELAGVFRNILDVAADIDTAFVAPAATVSQFNRAANREDVYFAMFRPSLTTRWDGNLKRYSLNKPAGSDEVVVVDRMNLPAFDEVDGGVRANARSYWPDEAANGAADGSDVAAGGAAHQLTLARKLRTWVRAAGVAAPPLVVFSEDNGDIDAAALGIDASDTAHRTRLLRWARGVDVLDVDEDGDTDEVRHQIGDPMHTTPFILNYPAADASAPPADPPTDGDDPDGRSIVFLGTNEGFLHAIDAASGSEVFGIIPPDLLPNLDRFHRDASTGDRPYGLDGSVSGWHGDTNGNLIVDDGETAYVTVGMRRGGRNYYTFDVSDPDEPTLAWEIRGGQGDFVELGQSWSRPMRTRVRDAGTIRDVLVFGAGYDAGNDKRLAHAAGYDAGTTGQGIFIVDVHTGALVHALTPALHPDMRFSIPSDVNVVDIDVDGFADMLWVGDMGGQLWRFDIDGDGDGSATLGSTVTGAAVARLGGQTLQDNRRFHYPPDIALMRDESGRTFLNVGIGSGWRAHPLDEVVQDRFYVFRDAAIAGPPRDEDGAVAYPALTEASLFDATDASVRDDTSGRSATGWYLTLGGNGEKVLSGALTVNGQILFTTYVPDGGQTDDCSVSVGGGRLYVIDALHGDAIEDGADTGSEAAAPATRWARLKSEGIPPPVQAFTPSVDIGKPIVLVGGEQPRDLAFGSTLTRTYWAEH